MGNGRGGLQIDRRGDHAQATLRLAGELDISCSQRLQEAVARECARELSELTIDLSGLTFIDSSGLAAVVYASRLCERHGCRLTLVRGAASVQRVFEITGLTALLPFRAPPVAGEA